MEEEIEKKKADPIQRSKTKREGEKNENKVKTAETDSSNNNKE